MPPLVIVPTVSGPPWSIDFTRQLTWFALVMGAAILALFVPRVRQWAAGGAVVAALAFAVFTIQVLMVAASLFFSLAFSYLYIWTVAPQVWPSVLPELKWPLASAALLLASSGLIHAVGRLLNTRWSIAVIALACLALAAGLYCEYQGQWLTGLRPSASSYGALVYTFIALQSQLAASALIMGLYIMARHLIGKLNSERRATYDNTMLFWHYTVGQGLLSLLIVHGFPRVAG